MSLSDGDTRPSEWIWRWATHEDALFHSRAEFFMLSETVLLTAFSQIVGWSPFEWSIRILLAIAGFVISLYWLMAATYQTKTTLQRISNRFKELARTSNATDFEKFYLEVDEGRKCRTSTNTIMGKWAPTGFSVLWMFVLAGTVFFWYTNPVPGG